ncbi:MAG: hypothetical protein O3A37_04270 [Planctomycetota bacterium]|nr:hypothetical protein [Planctomycetota bacterium]
MSSASSFDRSAALVRVVSRTRAGLVATVLAAGFCLAVAAAIGWVVGGIILDLVTPLPVEGRVGIFVGWWGCVTAAVIAFLLVPALRRPSLDTVAVLIEQTLGGMHNRLLTVIDIVRGRRGDLVDGAPDGRAMVERLVTQTTARLDGYRPRRVIKGQALARNVALAIVAAAALVWMALFFGNRFSITLARFLDPTADIPPATWLQLTSPGPLEVLEGEPLEIGCDVARGKVDNVSLVLTAVDGPSIRYPLRTVATGRFALTLDGLDTDGTYRLEGGNTWTKTYPITVLRRPVIEEVATTVRLPNYMRIDEPLAVAADAVKVEAPYGSSVEFSARVSGDVADGGVKLLERSVEKRVVERVDERIWFEDDLPRDAVSPTAWRWTTASAAGGLRAFMVDQSSPLVMKTRLNPFVLPKDGRDSKALCVHVKVDATDPPRALATEWNAGGRRLEVVWGDASLIPEVGAKRIVAGPLPASNEWTRLEVPLAGAAQEITGHAVDAFSLRLDRGRLLVDRPGWLVRGSQSIEEPIETLVGNVVAIPEDNGRWLTRVTVDAPRMAAIEFRSSRGHPTLPRPGVEIVPTVDKPPSLVVQEPPASILLEAPIDVPVAAEVFDDWGLDEIGFQSGPDAEHLGPRTPLPGLVLAERPPDVRRDVRNIIRSDALGLAAGRTVAWRLYVRDTKGQITDGPVQKIAVSRPPEHALADSQVPAAREAAREARTAAEQAMQRKPTLEEQREQVLDAVGEESLTRIDAAKTAAAAAAEAEETVDEQEQQGNAEAKQAAEKLRDEARQEAATTVKEAQAVADEAVNAFDEPAKQALAAAETQLEAQRADATRLAEAVAKAAKQAMESSLVPEGQAEALAALAERAAKLEESLAKEEAFSGAAAEIERVATAPTTDEVAREAEAISAAVDQIAEAIDAAGAAQRLAALTEELTMRAELLDSLPREINGADETATQEATPSPGEPSRDESADATQPAREMNAKSSPLAKTARQQLGELQRILGTEQTSRQPPVRSSPSDGREPASATGSDDRAAEPGRGDPPLTEPSNDALAEAADGATSGEPTTDQPLLESLAAGVNEARQTAAMVADLATKITEQATAAVHAPNAAEASEAATSLAETLTGEPVQSALEMAERARGLAAMQAAEEAAASERAGQGERPAGQADQPGQSGQEPGEQPGQQAGMEEPQGPAGRGPNDSDQPRTTPVGIADADRRGLDPAMRAAIEKLPPHVREPLLEGMRQQGPEAYRKVIEAYFKRLGKEIPR